MREIIRDNEKKILVLLCLVILILMGVLCAFRTNMKFTGKPKGTYTSLSPDTSNDDPLAYIGEDFSVKEGFHTNLPIVILNLDSELPDYKTFKDSKEIVEEGVDPYTTGKIRIIDTETGTNTLKDSSVYESLIKIKTKGHSSYYYDKQQYKIKALNADGSSNDTSILGMGAGSEWVINGSMADKSMIRNYLAYRIASEIDGNNMAPDSRFCEVMMERDGQLYYQGVFLLMETVSRGEDRVNIDKYNPKNIYSSYIVRRDRYTSFDIMLNTYGRLNNIGKENAEDSDNWIGLKYPSASKVTPETINYIEKDFSKVESILYSEDERKFRIYDKYINVDSFVDYFLINEYFGNYDAGEHSTYMYKSSGDVLSIGPVWDYDQAMNNSWTDELITEDIAFQTQPFFRELANDKKFIKKLKERYAELSSSYLSLDHVFDVIDETVAYLNSAQKREWYRWADDYLDGSGENPKNYNLEAYLKDGVLLQRFNDDYEEEINVIKKFFYEHSTVIQNDLTQWMGVSKYDTSVGSISELLFLAMLTMLLLPSYLIQRKG